MTEVEICLRCIPCAARDFCISESLSDETDACCQRCGYPVHSSTCVTEIERDGWAGECCLLCAEKSPMDLLPDTWNKGLCCLGKDCKLENRPFLSVGQAVLCELCLKLCHTWECSTTHKKNGCEYKTCLACDPNKKRRNEKPLPKKTPPTEDAKAGTNDPKPKKGEKNKRDRKEDENKDDEPPEKKMRKAPKGTAYAGNNQALQRFRQKYGFYNKKEFDRTKAQSTRVITHKERIFIVETFRRWAKEERQAGVVGDTWGTDKEWTTYREKVHKEIAACKNKKDKYNLTTSLKAANKFRNYHKERLKRIFQASEHTSVAGLRYNAKSQKYFATVHTKKQTTRDGVEEKTQEIPYDKQWILDNFGDEVLHFLHEREKELDGSLYFEIPPDLQITIHKTKTVRRVKYFKPKTTLVVDLEQKKVEREELEQVVQEMEEIRQPYLHLGRDWKVTLKDKKPKLFKRLKELSMREMKLRQAGIPQKEKHHPGKFIAVVEGGERCPMTREEVLEKFGETYTAEVMNSSGTRFFDVPVGDAKESHLHLVPELATQNAPLVHYTQSDSEDLCIFKSFASAIHNLGWVVEGGRILEEGTNYQRRGLLHPLACLQELASKYLPGWLQCMSIRRVLPIGWQDITDDMIVIGVLNGTDGHVNHAVTINGGWIYDANEIKCIPLSQRGLDYCISTPTHHSTFLSFYKGWVFKYQGDNQHRLNKLRGIEEA